MTRVEPAKDDAIQPSIIPRSDHRISRANISQNALKVLYRLKDSGHQAYLVGGGVRDLLLGREPKDFDVVTDARPEEVRKLFRNCRLIGRRFVLAHVRFGREIVEVATFRAPHDAVGDDEGEVAQGRLVRDNVYGTIEQDAWRRDLTINALYYDIRDFSVVDYVGGMADLQAGRLSLIGDARARCREDPVRMLRAIRFAAKLGFKLDPNTEAAIAQLGHLLEGISSARLFDEVLKLFHGGAALQTFEMLRHYGLFQQLFPATEAALAREEHHFPITFVANALRNTDERVGAGKPVTPAFLYAALLWESVRLRARVLKEEEEGLGEIPALQSAASAVLSEQVQHTALPKRFAVQVREIWALQPRFEQPKGKRALRLVDHPRFRAAYDFFCLRAQSGESSQDTCDWWTRFQEAPEAERKQMLQPKTKRSAGRRRRRSRNRPAGHE